MITLTTGREARATNHRYPYRAPVLVLDFGPTSVLVTTSPDGEVTAQDVEFARQLAGEAYRFAREVERRHSPAANPRRAAA
ncbi:hypothetical protein HNP84_008610 [Thermocatellispora tengchongensis]|uniref:Uncharacterized protein n=1 Tax=Thermocatellispora tengchongensis TaxID=1073253 RepID=A0A840PI87_9ACTN|nr:hypothetical protein [Thermocatellispora tengchongensis]MBB5138852.1 hypothetical protein [Thermocatellispora tengchongensis]